MALHIGRQSQLYIKADSAYAGIPSLAASNFLRHRPGLVMQDNPYNREYSQEKKTSAGHFSLRDRKHTAGFTGLAVELRPSGTVNTLPEISALLEAAFGSKTNTTLATTVTTGTGLVGGCTLTSGTGLAKWDALLITCPDAKKRLRFITAVNTGTGVVTWAPQLPSGQAPADGAAVKCVTTYKLATANALSLAIARYTRTTAQATGLKELLLGAAISQMSVMLDDKDPVLTFSGIAAKMLDPTDGSFPSQPGSDTQVGPHNSPYGMSGELMIDNLSAIPMKVAIELSTGMKLRNDEMLQSVATEAYRVGYYEISVALDARTESSAEATLYDKAFAGTRVGVFHQQGPFSEGNNFAFYMPSVDVPPPDTDSPMEEVNWPFKGRPVESVENENNGLILAIG